MAKANRGGKGRASGGGGVDPANIINEEDLLSKEGKQTEIGEFMTTVKDLSDDYAITVSDFKLADFKGKDANTIACFGGDVVTFNKKLFNIENLNKAYDDSTRRGDSPSRGNKTAIQAVAAHELGHKVNEYIANSLGVPMQRIATDIVNEARRKEKFRGVVIMERTISKYATAKGNMEALAEAWTDVYCNGAKATRASHAIVSVMKNYLKNII